MPMDMPARDELWQTSKSRTDYLYNRFGMVGLASKKLFASGRVDSISPYTASPYTASAERLHKLVSVLSFSFEIRFERERSVLQLNDLNMGLFFMLKDTNTGHTKSKTTTLHRTHTA